MRHFVFLRYVFAAIVGAALILAPSLLQADVKIASFNIENLGTTKAAKPEVVEYLAGIIRKFDIVAVQEVSDIHEKVPKDFLNAINTGGHHYKLILSERTGRQANDKTAQEQYAFYYNTDVVEALDGGALFDDSGHDLFQREPFTAHFKLIGTTLTFTITEVHTQPSAAVAEIDALFPVYEDVRTRYPSETRHIILGDLNASCKTAKPAQLNPLKIRGSKFFWVVPDTADTTVAAKPCAYDRIILSTALKKRFKAWGVANWFSNEKYSDHWPVWVLLSPDN
jgi:endonuclease/exonuclease/phosphatase family metal-dependent hydrolase